MDNKQDEFEERKLIEPIPGQMCYDEFLFPESEEEKEVIDTSVAVGQLDLWSVSAQPRIDEKADVKETTKSEIQSFEKKIEIEEKLEENFQENAKQKTDEKPQEKSNFEVGKESEILEEKQEQFPEIYDNKVEENDDVILRQNGLLGTSQEDNFEKVVIEKDDNFEKEDFAFQSPKKLRKFSDLQNESLEDSTQDFVAGEKEDFAFEENETEDVDKEKMMINIENPSKKLEKSEIYASKSHFFGNYENPFDE